MSKKLYKSSDNSIISGLIGGLGEYFDLDPVLLRAAWIAITVLTGFLPGIIYLTRKSTVNICTLFILQNFKKSYFLSHESV